MKVNEQKKAYKNKSDTSIVRERKSVVVERALEVIHKEHGEITAQLVLTQAEDEASPLHRYFEWDDGVAAQKYRLMQAMNMLMASKFVCMLKEEGKPAIDAVPREVRKWLPQFGPRTGFKMRNEVLATDDGRASFIERKLSVLRAWCAGVVDIPELEPVRKTVLGIVQSYTGSN